MKASVMAAAAAALVGGVSAAHHRHAHDLFHAKKGMNDTGAYAVCTTIYTTITGEFIWTPTPGPSTTSTPATTSVVPAPTSSTPAVVPTPLPQTCATPGVYTFPATTLTLTETTTVCAASTTKVPTGTHTLGGVTTVVETATTVVCPVATVKTSGTVVTSVIETTTYVCPSAGTYTIGATTATVTATETVVVVPVITTYCPGTYTAPAVVTTITETDVVVYCPFTSPAPAPAPAPTTSAAPAPPASSSPAAVSSSAPAKPSGSSSGSTPSLGGSGNKWAITYTPYNPNTGACQSKAAVFSDIAAIAAAGFKSVRVYSTDCDTLPNVGAACEAAGVKLILGIFIKEAGCGSSADVTEQISAIKAWAKWELVEIVVIANEAIFNGYCTATELASLITEVKTEFSAAGYTGLYTTTDVVSAWLEEGVAETIGAVVDVACTNAHAYFNSQTSPSEAGAFVEGQRQLVEKACGKKTYICETGYPSGGSTNGLAIAGPSEQATAIQSIQEACGDLAVLFSWTNDLWKQAGEYGCEQKFGLASLFGQ